MNDNKHQYSVYLERDEDIDQISVTLSFPASVLKYKSGTNTIHDMYFDFMANIDDEIKEL